MKKISTSLSWVLVVTLIFSMLVFFSVGGCKATSETTAAAAATTAAETTAAETTAAETTAATESPNETGVLKLDWFSGFGTDSVLECTWTDTQSWYHEMVFDTLIKYDLDGKTIKPRLASLETSSDGKTYTFTLVDNIKWHDGTEFSAEDVLFSFNTYLQVPLTSKVAFDSVVGYQDVIDGKSKSISGITASGNKVIIKMSKVDAFFPRLLTFFRILPEHLLKDVDPTLFTNYEPFWKKPVGTGMYKIDKMSYPNYFTLVRNDDYWGPKPLIKNVLFTSYITGGVEAVYAALIAGELYYSGGTMNAAVNNLESADNVASKNPDVKVKIVPANYFREFWFNTGGYCADGKYNSDMQKPEVRRAFNLIIDKEAVASFYGEQGNVRTTVINSEHPMYNSNIPLWKRDVEKAKEMLTSAGFDFSRTIRLLYYYDDQITFDIMELVEQNFAEAGIKLDTALMTGDVNKVMYEDRNYEIVYAGNNPSDVVMGYGYQAPDGGIIDKILGDVELRQKIFGDPINQYKQTMDYAERKKIGDQLQLDQLEYCYLLPIYGLDQIVMYNSEYLKLDEKMFTPEWVAVCADFKIETWELLK